MRLVIGEIIDSAQDAFIQGSAIVDNIHIAQELLRKYARKKDRLDVFLRWTFKRLMIQCTVTP